MRISRSLMVVVLVLLAGCQKLNFDKTVKMGPGDVHAFTPDVPRGEQKVTISVQSSASEVDVYVVPEKDADRMRQALLDHVRPATTLGKLEKTRSGSLEVTLPAKIGYTILLAGAAKDSDVQIKLTGK